MITDGKRTIGYICPECRNAVIIEKTVFSLAAAGNHLECPCGKSSIDIEMMGDRVRLKVPCIMCEESHTVTCSTSAFLGNKTLAFSCGNTGLDCCYVGDHAGVFAAMERLEEAVDGLERQAGSEGMFLNDIVMEEILGEIKDIGQRNGISCDCGSKRWSMKVSYSSVELTCADCGGSMRIPAATISDIEDLCCKPVLRIHGRKDY